MKLRNKNTGEIFELDKLPKWLKETIQLTATFYSRECEVYEPVEPLIKDEKIRKAVRAWAEASDVGAARVATFAVFDIETSARIFFYSRVIEDKDYDEEKTYTIAELCGEEE